MHGQTTLQHMQNPGVLERGYLKEGYGQEFKQSRTGKWLEKESNFMELKTAGLFFPPELALVYLFL